MSKVIVRAKTRRQLAAMAQPERANQPEALPWVLYDTQTFTQGTTTNLDFFTTVQTNKSLGNMESAGALPHPQFFEVHYIGMDVLQTTNNGGATGNLGALDDICKLLFGDAGTGADSGRFYFEMSNKKYGPFPLSFLHCSGGAVGNGWGSSTADTKVISYANNGVMDGGFHVGGNIVIPPKVGFHLVLEWGGTVTLAADKALRVWMQGVLHRRVL
jgi:hypothetical protein